MAVNVAEADPRVGVVGFRIFEPSPGDPDGNSGFDIAKAAWSELEVSFPKYVGGMAMFVRAELFPRIGLIDEGFFAYGEENDFQIRARKAGYSVVAINVPVWHYGQAAFGKIPKRAALLQVRNNIRLLIKHGSLSDLVRSGWSHVRRRVMAHSNKQPGAAVERRLRSSSALAGLAVLLYGVLWNLLNLPGTLKRREQDNRRALEAANLWRKAQIDDPARLTDTPH
jgi:hypothetical protein